MRIVQIRTARFTLVTRLISAPPSSLQTPTIRYRFEKQLSTSQQPSQSILTNMCDQKSSTELMAHFGSTQIRCCNWYLELQLRPPNFKSSTRTQWFPRNPAAWVKQLIHIEGINLKAWWCAALLQLMSSLPHHLLTVFARCCFDYDCYHSNCCLRCTDAVASVITLRPSSTNKF